MTTPARSRRDFAALEARRFQAAGLFARGTSQGAVARALGVTSVTVHHWYHAWHANGRAGLKAAGRAGRKPKLGPTQLAKIEQALRAGPREYGFSTDLWTLPRVMAHTRQPLDDRRHAGQGPEVRAEAVHPRAGAQRLLDRRQLLRLELRLAPRAAR